MNNQLDTVRLSATVKAKRQKLGIGLRYLSSQIDCASPSTLSRVERGKIFDIEIFLAICNWLQVDARTFIMTDIEHSQDNSDEITIPEKIEVLLHSDPNLDRGIATAMVQMLWSAYKLNDKLTKHGLDVESS